MRLSGILTRTICDVHVAVEERHSDQGQSGFTATPAASRGAAPRHPASRSAAGQRRPKNMILAKKNNQSELHHILPPKARLNFPEANLDTHDSDADETAVMLRDNSLADLTLRLLIGRG